MLTKKNKKRQIRRCSICDKIGHNKSTCVTKIETQKNSIKSAKTKKSEQKPVKFFIHHVGSDPLVSQHLVNLKKDSNNAWGQVKSYSGEKSNTPLYHFYHNLEQKTDKKSDKKSLMVNLNNFNNIFPKENIIKKEI